MSGGKMSLKRTLIYAALLGAVAFYIFRVELPKEEAEQRKELLFPGIAASSFQSVQIRKGKEEPYVLENREPKPAVSAEENENKAGGIAAPDSSGKWTIAGLPEAQIEGSNVSSLVSALKEFKLDSAIPANEVEQDNSIYGMKEPPLTLTVKSAEGEKEILFGKLNEFVGKRYTKVSGRTDMYLVSDWLYNVANKSRNDFRSKTPVAFLDNELKELALASPAGKVVLEQSEDLVWKIKEPLAAPAGSSAVSEVLRAARDLNVQTFIDGQDDKLIQFGLENPLVTLSLAFRENLSKAPLEILVGKTESTPPAEGGAKSEPKADYYFKIRNKPGIYKSGIDIVTPLSRTPQSLREKKLFQFAAHEVSEATFEAKDAAPVVLSKKDSKWLVNGKPADEPFVRELFMNLSNLEAEGWPTEGAVLDFDAPRLKISLKLMPAGGSEHKIRTLVVGAETMLRDRTAYYVGVDDLSAPFVIPEVAFKKLFLREETLLAPTPTPAPSAKDQAAQEPAEQAGQPTSAPDMAALTAAETPGVEGHSEHDHDEHEGHGH